ncbi:hypothetical protein AXG93_4907s1010 [Marchantia polymorpha subsp. ruderalis]|uniref:Uncharacterized protein n=1 Tax=Marchantia polymorpha subsp. ruderalis TaxID=1480154 RepID=A0A176WFQ0_MARPO|nr:hypothetical protein AXG93_4907s1010 [Marchantia polymorpha subsp. ruderalis]
MEAPSIEISLLKLGGKKRLLIVACQRIDPADFAAVFLLEESPAGVRSLVRHIRVQGSVLVIACAQASRNLRIRFRTIRPGFWRDRALHPQQNFIEAVANSYSSKRESNWANCERSPIDILFVSVGGQPAALAQLVERKALNLVVGGSSPPGGADQHRWSRGRIVPCHGTDPGSIPGRCSFLPMPDGDGRQG